MVCPKCGSEVKAGSDFCVECGCALTSKPQEKKAEKPKKEKAEKPEKTEEHCSICGEQVAKHKLADGCICSACMEKMFDEPARWRKTTVAMVNNSIRVKQCMDEQAALFHATDEVAPYFAIDKDSRMLCANGRIYIAWEDVIDFKVIENGNEINYGNFGGALFGGMLFGGTGAIIGQNAARVSVKTVTELAIKIVARNEMFPQIRIDLVKKSMDTNSRAYKRVAESAEKILTLLTIVTDTVQKEETAKSASAAGAAPSPADEIKKYKDLMDEGTITQEEFEAKKKQLLNLSIYKADYPHF